jgi:hypothetical protein
MICSLRSLGYGDAGFGVAGSQRDRVDDPIGVMFMRGASTLALQAEA